jgi:serine O-acetyltransferase
MSEAVYSDFIRKYVSRQLETMFPAFEEPGEVDSQAIATAVRRTNHCVSRIKAFKGERFEHLNSGHYATFLYYLSHALWKDSENNVEATRVFLLNKALNGIDLFYEVEMPDVFLIGHTVGMVFAKASYGNSCVFHQGCTVGRNQEARPTLESGVILYPHASVIGACHLRENTVVSPGVQLVNTDTPGNCLVFPGGRGKPIFKAITEYYADRYLLRP